MKKLIGICVIIAMVAAAMPSMGTMIYTDEAAFTGALQPGSYLNEFSGYNWNTISSPINFGPVNGWTYSISADGGLWGLPTYGGCLSTTWPDAIMTVTFTGSQQVTAVGGLFFGSDWDGYQQNATIYISLNDGTIEEYTSTSYSDFRGFISSVPFTSLSISIPGVPHDQNWRGPYPTLDHLYVGDVASGSIPEPATIAILGFGALSLIRRKK
jgi:hypothetical protein